MQTCCELLIHFCPPSHSCLYWTSFTLRADLLLISVCFGGKEPTSGTWLRDDVTHTVTMATAEWGHGASLSSSSPTTSFSLSLSLFLAINVLLCRLYHSSTFGRRCEEMSRLKGSGERNEEGLPVTPSLHSLERHVQRLLLHSSTSNLHKSHYTNQALK